MNCPLELARPLAYWVVTFGCVLAVVTAFEPEPTGAWHLAAGYLVCGLIPYIVYGSFTDILNGCTLVIAGSLLLASDLLARFGANITSAVRDDVHAAIWLCLFLVLLVLPLGVALGKLLSRIFSSGLHSG
ncbi:MAG: hypothetical protein U9Q19_11565 [Pseudomonadota bacterium]|nr:hypothetical protein [Pseudomonadota bacterium]